MFFIFLINTGQLTNDFGPNSEFIYALTCNFQKLYLANVNDDLCFEYEEETSVRNGCSATLHDKFWYFGRLDTTLRQVRGLFQVFRFSEKPIDNLRLIKSSIVS